MQSRYLVVAGACLTQFTIIGLLFSFGLFFKVFEAEYGWSRTLMSASSALSFLMMGVLAMLGGRLSDRYGPARVLGVTGVLYGLGFALLSQVTQPWQLFAICGTFIGLGLSTHDVVTLSTVARWFEGRRGIMTAVVKVGTAAGQVALPPLVALLISGMGWRPAVIVLGLGAVVLLLIAALLMKSPPLRPAAPGPSVEQAGGQTGAQTGSARGGAPGGLSFAEARRSLVLWTLCAVQFCFFASLMTVPLHLPIHGMDLGLSTAAAATLLSVVGGASVAGRLAVGRLVDVIGGRRAFVMCFVALIAGLGGLTVLTVPWALFVTVAVYGFAHGALFVVVSPTVAEYFGMRAHGAIFGTVLFSGTLGGSVGPILTGMVFDRSGSYVPAFVTLTLLAGVALALVLSLPRPSASRVAMSGGSAA
ncbi:MFS transporter [Antarcticimicrobium luteum]|uniref:MFS transporter n=1 Tax=Antarcticimicrobium luteum TaxID=2547397 RepID=A0A4R5UPY6_9RHOB|nr:MFS transporter [Antarcticimicrobium luteum]TDK41094.1 MFS transporter [Antarcticimicrobium luteum]